MRQQKTKIQIEKDMNVLREKIRMKEETTPKKLLSHKGDIDCSKCYFFSLHGSREMG